MISIIAALLPEKIPPALWIAIHVTDLEYQCPVIVD
jgi:hypothetical protein